MARSFAINAQDVEKACEELKRQDKPITPHRIKTVLGKGRISTIAYFLSATKYGGVTNTDDPLTQRLVSLLYPVAQEINEDSEEKIRNAQQDLMDKVSALKEQLNIRDAKIISLERSLSQAASERDKFCNESHALSNSAKELDHQVSNKDTEIEQLEKRLTDAKDQINKNHAAHQEEIKSFQANQEALIAQKEASLILMDKALKKEEEAKQYYKEEAESKTKMMNNYRRACTGLETKLERAESDIDAAHKEIKSDQSELSALTKKYNKLNKSHNEYTAETKSKIDSLVKSNKSNEESVKKMNSNLLKLESLNKELEETKTKLKYSEELLERLTRKI